MASLFDASDESREMNGVSERLQQVMADLTPGLEPTTPGEFVHLVEIADDIEVSARELLQASVLAARHAGATWGAIGASLGISKQAAQKRFTVAKALPAVELDANERLLGPVGLADEIDELNLAGRYGWHSVGFGVAHHHVVHSDTQWEHIRVIGIKRVSELVERDGWTIVGRAFPYTLLKRNTGNPALDESRAP